MIVQRAIAAKVGSDRPSFQVLPRPLAPARDEVLCRTLQLGICGTDREILASRNPSTPDGENHLVLGHECLACVESVGDEVEGFRAGQLVVPTVRRPLSPSSMRVDMLPCGEYTERGIVKQHGFSQPLWREKPEFLLPVEDDLAEVAVYTEPQAVAEKAVNEAIAVQRGRLGEQVWKIPPPRVLVTGQGPIAFAALIACRARHWPVTVLGRDQDETYRTRLARDLGATQYLSLARAGLGQVDADRDGYDLLLECTGSGEVLLQASQSLAARGVAVWLGAARDSQPGERNVQRLMRHAVLRNHLHLGSVNAAPRDFADGLAHLRALRQERPETIARLFTSRMTFDEALNEYTTRRAQTIKVVIEFDAAT